MKPKLTAATPVGVFTRASSSAYTHIVVWNSPRAMRATADGAAVRGAVARRWVKDHGYGVTWHLSEQAAKSAARKYGWDLDATLVGVFPVTA